MRISSQFLIHNLSLSIPSYRYSLRTKSLSPALAMSFDKDLFRETIKVLALRVPLKRCNELMKKFRGFTLEKPRMKCLVQDGQQTETKLLLLDEKLHNLEALGEDLYQFVSEQGFQQFSHEVTFDYSCLNSSQALRKLLPSHVDVPSAFECVGHIAHVNLREEQLPFKAVIGQVLLDKNPQVSKST